MNRIGTYLGGVTKTTRTILLGLAVVFVSAGIAQAATTISTNITTAGTLSVTDQTTLGQATSTRFSAYSAYFGGSATSTFGTNGALTLVAGLSGTTASFSGLATFLGGATTTQLTLLSGDTIKNATASSTVLSGKLITNTASTSQLIVGGDGTNGTLSGLVLGTCQLTATAIKTASTTLTCTATGMRVGDKVFLTPPSNLESWIRFVGATTTTADQIAVQVLNASTTADVTGALRPWAWMGIR